MTLKLSRRVRVRYARMALWLVVVEKLPTVGVFDLMTIDISSRFLCILMTGANIAGPVFLSKTLS